MNARAARDEAHVEEGSVSSLQQLGQRLRQAREARGLNVQDIAARLHLSASVVATIENGAFEQLPAATYARGYMRAYANLVGVKPDALLAAYDQYATQPPELNPFASTPQPQVKATDLPVRMVTYAVIAIVVGLLGAWLWQSHELSSVASLSVPKWGAAGDAPAVVTETVPTGVSPPVASAPAPAPGAAAPPVTEPAPLGVQVGTAPASAVTPQVQPTESQQSPPTAVPSPSTPPAPDGTAVPVWADTAAPIANAAEPMPGPQPAPPPAQTAAAPPPGDEAPVEQSVAGIEPLAPVTTAMPEVAPGGAKVLSFELAEDAWLEVTDAEDKRLYYNMGKQGSRISVQGVMPYRVKVGNAPAVSVSFEGRPLDISAFSYESVARFSVTPDGFLAQP